MKRIGFCALAALALAAAAGSQTAPGAHVMVTKPELKWGDAPAVFPKGAQLAVLSGDPFQKGLYAVRLRMPAGYKIAPHWHPTDERVTVIEGTFWIGMGETFDPAVGKELPEGGYAVMPAEMRHFAWTKDGATVQVDGAGPFAITYVNPQDDPSRMASR